MKLIITKKFRNWKKSQLNIKLLLNTYNLTFNTM